MNFSFDITIEVGYTIRHRPLNGDDACFIVIFYCRLERIVMQKRLPCVALLMYLLAFSIAQGGEPQGRPLSPQETDQAINAVFSSASGVVRMEADIITQKTGGMNKGMQTSYEFLRMETPTRMWLQNRGESQLQLPLEQSSLIIVDGRNIWEVEPRSRESRERSVSWRAFRPNLEGRQAQGLAAFIGLFLMGKEVTSATGIREDFDIRAFEEQIPNRRDKTLHFILQPRRGGETLELWMYPQATLPWRIRSFERKVIRFPPPKPGEQPRFRLEETVRTLRNVKTNLDGLPPFNANAFMLPLAQDMLVRDETTNQVISHDQVRQELNAVRSEYQASAGGRR
jgi:hypothetical protein